MLIYQGTKDLTMPNHVIERIANPVNQLAIPQEDSPAGTDQSYIAHTVSHEKKKGSMQNILVKQEKASSNDPPPITKLSGTGEHIALCFAIACNPTLWKIQKNLGLAGKS